MDFQMSGMTLEQSTDASFGGGAETVCDVSGNFHQLVCRVWRRLGQHVDVPIHALILVADSIAHFTELPSSNSLRSP